MIGLCSYLLLALISQTASSRLFSDKKLECGEYGFKCYDSKKLKLCQEGTTYGPTFLCPANTLCNEASSDVCQTTFNYIDPTNTRATSTRCRRYERLADTTVPGCKGYILCIPNKNKFQGVRFKCTGNTIFNGKTRSCSASDKYKCPPIMNLTSSVFSDIGHEKRGEFGTEGFPVIRDGHISRPIDCKSYRFSVRDENNPTVGRAAYFCPSKAMPGESHMRCTVFSNQFCITLQKEEEEDQFLPVGTKRKPRLSRNE